MKYRIGLFSLLVSILPFFAAAQSLTGMPLYNNNVYGYSVMLPSNWTPFEKKHTALKGGIVDEVLITQETDLASRPIKVFEVNAGPSESVFGLKSAVVEKLSRDELVDFYIDQLSHSLIDFRVTDTHTTGTGDGKVYAISANYAVPGFRAIATINVQFKNGRVYIWTAEYLNQFPQYATTLKAMSESMTVF